jgi:predicted DNA binding protein/GAF domain-containing protein
MSVALAIADLIGAVGFVGGFVLAVRLYRRQWLLANYWLIAAVGSLLLGAWALVEAAEGLGLAPTVLESRLQILVVTTGVTAVLLLAVYDNTEHEALLRRLHLSERHAAALVEQFPDGGVVLLNGRLRCLEAGGRDLLGVADTESLVGASLSGALDPALAGDVKRQCQRALAGETVTREVNHAGEIYRVTARPIDDVDGEKDSDDSGLAPVGSTCMLVVRNVTADRERERTLASQRDELATLDEINRVIRDVDHALVGADSRREIERAVCDRLAGSGPYLFAVVAELEDGERFVPRTWGGVGERFVDEVFPVTDAADTPAGEAFDSGEIRVIENVEDDPAFARWREAALDQEFRSLALVPIHHEDRSFGVLGVFADRPEAFDERERAVLDQFGETIGYAIDSLEHRERADLLTDLHRTTRQLVSAESDDDVTAVVVEACRNLLSVDAVLFTYDERESTLTPAGATERGLAFYGTETPTFAAGDEGAITWDAFVAGEVRVFDDVRTADNLWNTDTGARSALFVPLGDHGVLAAGSTERAVFRGTERTLVELLAATAETAYDRIDRENDLRARERELRERNEQLTELQQITDIIRDIDRTLVAATTRDEIEQTVCEKLTSVDRCQFAWIGERDDDGSVTPRAWAGAGGSYLDAATFDDDPLEPVARTLEAGEPTTVETVGDHVQEAEWVSAALTEGFQSVVSVPLSQGASSYGALTLYSGTAGTFDEESTTVIAELAETIAHAIDAVETKRGLHAAPGTELELRVTEPTSFLNEVAGLSDDPIEVIEAVPQSEGRTRIHFRVSDIDESQVRDVTDNSVVVEHVDHIGSHEGEDLYRAVVTGETMSETAIDLGGLTQSVTVDPGGTTLVVSLLPHVDAREFVERFRTTYETAQLRARREQVGSRSHAEFMSDLDAALTDRQLEVLRSAYESGYFETPRESSGEDVADKLGIAQPTVSHHLREAQRRVLGLLFGEREQTEPRRPE